ncbi:hypothetical protein DDZ18_10585 [Marinicauda salina]|uniref:Type I secretion protein TolC n=1 Tax=Marinicauda salina TaxID=2135793 RepID=A0A2U2BSZ8_9PROT|nr:TolC family outer membrane protein [Marinicauda salina]PWE17135.1 hypothetical protein DDZ18_10585 [Marinicauda salina]
MKRFAGVAAAAVMLFAAGQAAQAQSLEETLASAYRSNPTLAAERARLRQTEEGYFQARSAALPTVSAGAQVSESELWGGGNTFLFTGQTGEIQYSVSAQQALYRGGRTAGAMNQALARINAGRAGLRSTEHQVLVDGVAAHMNVIRDQQVIAIRRNNVEVLAEQLRAARDRFEVGEITRTDVAQAEARLSGARAQLAAAQSALAASRAQYERVVGVAPAQPDAPEQLPAVPESLDSAVDAALDNNPDLVAAQFLERAAGQGVRVARGALMPEVGLSVRASESRPSDFSGRARGSATVGAQLSIPIFTGGLNGSRVRQALAAEDEARLQVVAARRRVVEGVTNAWNNLLAAQAVIESSREAVRANEIAFEGVEQEAFVGLRTTLDVLNAEQELLNSRIDLVRAERDLYVASYALLQAMGRVGAGDLELPVEQYEAASRFEGR